MEPIPETVEAIEEYGPFSEGDLLQQLSAQAARVQAVTPDCVGLSVTSVEEAVTFTLVASSEKIAVLDGLQYVADNGPCVAAAKEAHLIAYCVDDPLDEEDWLLFAQGCAATGIASTLSLPILGEGQAVGSVNLYAATPDAFDGHYDELAAIFDAWAPGAVTNADLSFTTRALAQGAPQRLRDEVKIQVAVAIISDLEDVDTHQGREQLRMGAQRAGVSEAELAKEIVATGMDRRQG